MKIDSPQVRIFPRQRIRSGAMWLPMIVIAAGGISAIAFSIRFAKDHLQRTELRTATEAAANAAAVTFAETGDRQKAILRARELAAANQVAGAPFTLEDDNIRFVVRPAADSQSDQVVVAIEIRCDANPPSISSLLTRGSHRPCRGAHAEAIAELNPGSLKAESKLPEGADDEN